VCPGKLASPPIRRDVILTWHFAVNFRTYTHPPNPSILAPTNTDTLTKSTNTLIEACSRYISVSWTGQWRLTWASSVDLFTCSDPGDKCDCQRCRRRRCEQSGLDRWPHRRRQQLRRRLVLLRGRGRGRSLPRSTTQGQYLHYTSQLHLVRQVTRCKTVTLTY